MKTDEGKRKQDKAMDNTTMATLTPQRKRKRPDRHGPRPPRADPKVVKAVVKNIITRGQSKVSMLSNVNVFQRVFLINAETKEVSLLLFHVWLLTDSLVSQKMLLFLFCFIVSSFCRLVRTWWTFWMAICQSLK